MVESKTIHGTGPFIFFTGNVNSGYDQGSELPKQQLQLIIQNLQLFFKKQPMKETPVKLF